MKVLANSGIGVAIICLSLGLGCSPTKHDNPHPKPERDQVAFFERPATFAALRRSSEPVPSLILLETDPWAAVIGSDSPTFALYEDGTIIWRKGDGFRTTRLNRSEAEHLYAALAPGALRPFYGRYEAAPMTDQPEEDLLLYGGDKPTFVSVYGSLKSPKVRAVIPTEIASLYDRLKAFDYSPSSPWLPDKFEVMVWPYDYAPEASIEWPKDLPDLHDGSTVKRGDSFSIFVPAPKLEEVRAFLARRAEKGAIEIDGKKWAAAVRFPFPAERLWMAPNPEVKESDHN